MDLLKQRIIKDGDSLGNDIIKVDSFINHQIDVSILNEIGKEFKRIFENDNVTKILTIEASGIAIASIAAQHFNNCPVVFAKKTESRNLDEDKFHSEVFSFTKQKSYPILVSKKYINPQDRILIIDDFLANGKAVLALSDIVAQGGAELVGAGIVIEKGFQSGSDLLRQKGIRVESLAVIEKIENGNIIFKN